MQPSPGQSIPWPRPHVPPKLEPNEVQVWFADLETHLARAGELVGILAQDERTRASRLVFPNDREQFLLARGLLREILGLHLNVRPDQVAIGYHSDGKPSLLGPVSIDDLHFNVSHSQRIALYAFTRGSEVGVDVEQIRSDLDMQAIARQFYSQREAAELAALPPERRPERFFRYWTAKEAYAKGIGQGLGRSLWEIDVALQPEGQALLTSSAKGSEQALNWRVWTLDPCPGFCAAVAVPGNVWTLRCFRW